MTTQVDLDIRYFRRYPRHAEFVLPFKEETYEAKMVDYSLIGLGIVVNDLHAPVQKGDLISLDIDEPDLYPAGRVAWTAKTASGLRVGIVKTEPIKGRLSMYPLSDILLSLHRTRKTGVLQISSETINKKVFLRNGDIISAASNYDKDSLGDVLLKRRKINKKQYDRAGDMQRKTRASYVAILLHMGYLSAADIIAARKLQARRIISSLFLMRDSSFEFIEGALPQEDDIVVNLPIADVVYRETKKNADSQLLENYLLDSIVDFSPNPLTLFQHLRIPASDKSVLARVDGRRSIGDIVRLLGPHVPANPLKILYALLETRFLKITGVAPSPPGLRAGGGRKENDSFVDHVEELYSLHRKIDYYSILGTQPNDTEEMIKKAFFNAEMRYHSDMYPLIGEDLKNKLDEIFTYMKTAYQTLTDPKRRRQYDLGMEGISGKNAPDRNIEAGIRPEENDIHLSKAPKDSPSPWKVLADNSEKAKLTFRDGMVAFWDKDDRKAAELFEMATDLDCSMPEYPYMYGRVLGSLGRNKEALQALNRANELKPLDPDILVEMGHIYLSLGFPARAASYLNQAIKIEPSNKRAQDGLRKTSRKKAGGR